MAAKIMTATGLGETLRLAPSSAQSGTEPATFPIRLFGSALSALRLVVEVVAETRRLRREAYHRHPFIET